jgi:ribosomal protein S18 acetylase RimI-like enzyme
MMEIRKAGLEDFDVINNLAVRTWYPSYASILSDEQVKYMLDLFYSHKAIAVQIADKGHQFLLLADGGTYVGFASYELNYSSGTAKLHKLYVLPETQGKGAGRLLVEKIEAIAKENGNTRILLNVNRFNAAVNFYLKAGFTKIAEEDISIGNGYLMEDFIMQKYI